jgi:arginine decarboxylase
MRTRELIELEPIDQAQIEQARKAYNIAHWSGGYFDINEEGVVVVYPQGRRSETVINLAELIAQINQTELSFPVLVRFTDIIHQRISGLQQAFQQAIDQNNYQGRYLIAYPIKVNQQRSVVEQMIQHSQGQVGLEVGSKAELIAALITAAQKRITLVCNGYKDKEYIRLALLALQAGFTVYIILERMAELTLLADEAQRMHLEPHVGIRVRLASTCEGQWQDTGGEKAKFGFSVAQTLEIAERLTQMQKRHWLKVLHFHLGSQIANIGDIQKCLYEGARYYVELHRMGIPIHTVDLGGGLAIDYDGTRTRSTYSMNYTVKEYASHIVSAFAEVCSAENLPHPHIITESGRAITAHHAVLLTNIIDMERAPYDQKIKPVTEEDPPVLQTLWYQLTNISARSVLEVYHDACYWMREAHGMYVHGLIELQAWARIEQLYYTICYKVRHLLNPSVRSHRPIIDELNDKLADKYYVNFSLFQSLPDAWAIDQPFPILPISGLNKPLALRGVLQDITCDSDGRVDRYVDHDGLETTIPLPVIDPTQPNYLGIFLIGAYQEILGDMHNLFGDTHSLNVVVQPDGSYQLCDIQRGDTIETMLRYVNFDTNSEVLSRLDADSIVQQALHGYTYLED